MTYMPPETKAKAPSPRTIGLAVLLAGLMVGLAIVGWFLSPTSADVEHLSGICEIFMDLEIGHYPAYDYPAPQDAQDHLAAADAARRLYELEEC